MQKKLFSIILLILIYVIFSLDLAANQYFLYWRFWWFDIVMHFLGGLWIVLLSYYIFYLSGYFKKFNLKGKTILILSFFVLFLVGVFWELFEYLVGAVPETGYALDTCSDLAMNIVGGGIIYFFLLRNYILAEKEKTDRIIDIVKSQKSIKSKE